MYDSSFSEGGGLHGYWNIRVYGSYEAEFTGKIEEWLTARNETSVFYWDAYAPSRGVEQAQYYLEFRNANNALLFKLTFL